VHLVVFGLSVSSAWGNGHAALWRALIGALSDRGHAVTFFERDQSFYAQNRDLAALPSPSRLLLFEDWAEVQPKALDALRRADVAMVTSFCADGVAATGLIADHARGVRCFYDLDTPVTLAALDAGRTPVGIGPNGLRPFDLVLSYTGGAVLDALRTRLGARRVHSLYGWVDPSVHRPVPPDPYYEADLSYLGTYAEDRQSALEHLFVAAARRLPDRRFVIGGAQYPAVFPWSSNIWFLRHVPPRAHAAFYSSSRLTLNVTRSTMARMGWCPSGRLFEAAACGTPVLSDWWDGLATFFTPGEEIIIAHSGSDALAAIAQDRGRVNEIGARARQRALDCHTAEIRARRLIELIETPSEEASEFRPSALAFRGA
jgi:spore maturation protein CgeB